MAAAEHGAAYVLVTSVVLPPGKGGADQFLDNVLASAQGAITGEKFERFEVTFVGAGDTLAAALAALLASGAELHAAVGEALTFLDQSLDAGFRPGMGNVVPDRFFWALPPPEEGADRTKFESGIRPILDKRCMACHGDPKNSPSGDGKDALGFPMENMKLEDIKGAKVRAPTRIGAKALISHLAAAKQWCDLHSDNLSQAVLFRFAE